MKDSLVERVIERGGGLSVLAAACGVSRQLVDGWRRVGQVPAERTQAVARATGMHVSEIRPDLFPTRDRPRYVAERKGRSAESVFAWEVLDLERKANNRIVCIANHDDAKMICRLLNGDAGDEKTTTV